MGSFYKGAVIRSLFYLREQFHRVGTVALCLWLVVALQAALGAAALGQSSLTQFERDYGKCAMCHATLVDSYSKTAMAHASGLASDSPITGSFYHPQSRVKYEVYGRDGKLWLSFRRAEDPKLEGKRELLYYIGSGTLKGRTYLFSQDGFLFESPINWYAQQRVWDMTPNYGATREAPLNLPAFPECLNCHSSGMQAPIAGTANHYPIPPFTHAGISCERCHGDAANHVARGEKMLQISRLPVERQEQICMQCHLEGDVAVERPHQHAYNFHAGQNLLDFVRYFVFADKGEGRAVSQFEALAQSACKRASRDKMTCTTCHDPHFTPEASKKVEYFRAKCLNCHGEQFAEKHHPESRDCVSCHMPSLATKDISHTQATDHRILRVASAHTDGTQTLEMTLRPFPERKAGAEDDPRDLGLAYETLAERGDATAATKADSFLQLALQRDKTDAPVLAALGYDAQLRGDAAKAREYYEEALHYDEDSAEAATNLGVIEAREGRLRDSVALWTKVFELSPWRSSVGINIAMGYCAAERYDRAKFYVERVLEFNPDFGLGRSLLSQLNSASPSCSLERK